MELENLNYEELLQTEGGLIWFAIAGLAALASSCTIGDNNTTVNVVGNNNIVGADSIIVYKNGQKTVIKK